MLTSCFLKVGLVSSPGIVDTIFFVNIQAKRGRERVLVRTVPLGEEGFFDTSSEIISHHNIPDDPVFAFSLAARCARPPPPFPETPANTNDREKLPIYCRVRIE